jgi:hypothetical protein
MRQAVAEMRYQGRRRVRGRRRIRRGTTVGRKFRNAFPAVAGCESAACRDRRGATSSSLLEEKLLESSRSPHKLCPLSPAVHDLPRCSGCRLLSILREMVLLCDLYQLCKGLLHLSSESAFRMNNEEEQNRRAHSSCFSRQRICTQKL